MPNQDVDERSDFGALGGVLRRRSWLIALTLVVAVAAALFYSHGQPNQYQSTSVLLFRQVLLDVELTGVPLQVQATDPTVESATNVGLIEQANVRVEAARRLGPPYTAESLSHEVDISPQNKSDLVAIKATAGSPLEAARIANAVARSYLDIANRQLVSDIHTAEVNVRSHINTRHLTSAQRSLLQGSLVKLQVLASLGPQNVHLVQSAMPPATPSSPKPVRNAVIGGIIGLVLGFGLAFAAEQFDRRLRRASDIERETGLPLLATVPRSRRLRRPLRADELAAQDTEPFRQLASGLRHRAGDREIRSVLVTSTGPGSGKTTVALHLAAGAAAGLGSDVFLLEADLRRPRLGALLELPADRGLASLLENGNSEHPPIQTVNLGTRSRQAPVPGADPADLATDGVRTAGNLSLMLAGPPTDQAMSLLESGAVRDLIRSCRDRYELTVIDGPPPGLVADAIPLAKEVDAVIIVARLGHDTGPAVRRLRVELERLGIEPIGVVANFAQRTKNPYYAVKAAR